MALRIRRACLDCGGIIEGGARCQRCTRERDRHRGSRHQRGYDNEHGKAARAAIGEEPWCHWPGCGVTGDLTGHHLIPGDPSGGYTVLCRRHNTIEANQRRAAARRPAPR
jgi:hypothetical protein